MRLKNANGFGQAWLAVLIVIVGASVAGYYVFRSNSDSSDMINVQDAPSSAEADQVIGAEQQGSSLETEKESSTGTAIATGDSQFGTILFDGAGQAIYIWEVEKPSTAECYGDCAEAWPPVLTDGLPRATAGIQAELLGVTERTDGTTQVTYNGHPLYYYAHEDAGEVKCHNISTHGGLWWVIHPDGNRAE